MKGNPVPGEKKTIAKIHELSEINKREKSLQEKVFNVRSIYENHINRVQYRNIDQELA